VLALGVWALLPRRRRRSMGRTRSRRSSASSSRARLRRAGARSSGSGAASAPSTRRRRARGPARPVFFFTGRRDWNTPGALVEEWAAKLEAPHVEIVWFEGVGHLPPIEAPEAFQRAWIEKLAR
jgi:pimeloyl-ACP methyl ester carboxylesterase